MKKTYLLTPGPTPLPESVIAKAALPIMHHRTPEFEAVYEECRAGLKKVFQTEQEVMMLASTGSGAMNAAVTNLFSVGDAVITVNGGKFGDRWTKMANAYGLKPNEIKLERGDAVSIEQLEQKFKETPDAKAVLFQASETSTGVKAPTQEICSWAREKGILTVCDAITACGVFDLPMDDWGIDVLISGSQKAFMIPPGMAFIALSKKAWDKTETSDLPKFYFNLKKEYDSHLKNQSAWTPAITLALGLQESLKIMLEEGIQNVFKRHALQAEATRNAVKALGLELLSNHPSDAVTAVRVPEGVEGGKIPKIMREKYGVVIAGGQDELKGKIFRLSHFGYCGKFDITTGLSALELTLNDLGYKVEFGTAVGAALKTFAAAEGA